MSTDYEDEDFEDEEFEDEDEIIPDSTKQACFDLLVASFITNVLEKEDDEDDPEGDKKTEVIDKILDVLDSHLNEEGQLYLENAFIKFEKQYNIEFQTQEIIMNLEWNKDRDE